MTFDQVPWLALCVGLTVLGVVLTWAARRRGAAAVLRGLAWTLLPMAAYLTGTIEVLWRMGVALVNWATGLVFNLRSWVGVGLAGLAFLLFVVSGFLRARALERARTTTTRPARPAVGTGTTTTSPLPATPGQARGQVSPPQRRDTPVDDDFSEIEEILRRRGIK